MNKIKLSIFCFALSLLISGFAIIQTNAQGVSLTAEQTQHISENCNAIKNVLNQLHISDALLRVNIGQQYELVSTKLMERFNNRLSNNRFKIDDLKLSYNNYGLKLDSFRADYITYEESLSIAIKVDCKFKPNDFYQSLMSARNNRSRVYEDVKTLNQEIDQYRSAVAAFEKSYQAIGAKQ